MDFIKKDIDNERAHIQKQKERAQRFFDRKSAFEQEYGLEDGGSWTGSYSDGLKILEKHFPNKSRALPHSLKDLEKQYGKIKWETMSIKSVITSRGYRYDGARSDVTVKGVTLENNIPVEYRYMQGPSSYSGMRYYRYNNSSLRLMNTLEKDFNPGPYNNRSRDFPIRS